MTKKRVTLALQGGGSHGAFTWGVLDRLLEDDRIEIEGISGASASAINAVVLAHGYTVDGREDARQALEAFWQSVASKAEFNLLPGGWPTATPAGLQDPHRAVTAFLFLARFFSPYQLSPFNLNPLRDILAAQVDFERLRSEWQHQAFHRGHPREHRHAQAFLHTRAVVYPLKISLKPSRRLVMLLGLAHAAAAGAVLVVDVPIWLQLFLLVLIGTSCGLCLYGPALLRSGEAIIGLEIGEGGSLSFQTRRGEWREGAVLGSSFVSPYLTVLVVRTEAKLFARHVVIMPDSLAAEDFRRLRVRLHWQRAGIG